MGRRSARTWISLLGALALVPAAGCDATGPSGDSQGLSQGAAGTGLFINEVLANEPGSDPAGEFVEIVNGGQSAVDLSGYSLSDGVGLRHEFAGGSQLDPGQVVVVFGNERAIPAGTPAAIGASTGALGLSNGGDTVTLADDLGDPVDSITYTSSLSGTDGVSMNRDPDATAGADLVLHTELASAGSSPGTHADGSPFDGAPPPPPPPPPPDGKVHLRIVSANLTSGDFQSYDPGPGIRILQGLHPDIALVQEMNYGADQPADIRSFVDQAFGTDFAYARQSGVHIPDGVVSRYPIVESGVWDDPTLTDRDFVYAHIDLPGPTDLWAVSLHLNGSSSSKRATASSTLVADISSHVPAGDYLVVGGDFNSHSRGETCVTRLSQVVVTSAPYPRDQSGDEDTNSPRSRPYDWVLASPALDDLEVATEIGAQSFDSGLVFDTRVYSPLSDVSPAEAGDSAAPQMQHMAVVRDFEVPAPTP